MSRRTFLQSVGEGVVKARDLIADQVVFTPLLETPLLNTLVSRQLNKQLRVVIKAESLQHTGSFKFRGATNRVRNLTAIQKERGVVAFSSGNFAQALALASTRNGVKCTIVAPHDAPPLKLERTRKYGAEVVLSEPPLDVNREVAASSMAADIAEKSGATLLHPFNDPHVIHGTPNNSLQAIVTYVYESDDVAIVI